LRLTFPIRSDKLSMNVEATEHLASVQSPFQQIDVYDTPVFGRVLLLDGHVQLTEFDEHAYHEALVWVPLLNVPEPRTALVVGGGDGGVLRELCKHPGIERIEMVEIDEQVVHVCREWLPNVSGGAFDDPRVNLRIDDAFPYTESATGPYSLIVLDSTDVYEDEQGELSEMLFTEEFYTNLRRLLSDDGFVVTQVDNPVFCPYSLRTVADRFSNVFRSSGNYWSLVPSFGGFSAFCWGSKGQSIGDVRDNDFERIGLKYLGPLTYRLGLEPVPTGC
jgi:spermidine synthase